MKNALLSIAVTTAIAGSVVSHAVAAMPAGAGGSNYQATLDIRDPGQGDNLLAGFVFEDLNRNGRFDLGEPGIEGVMVSNGLDVVATDDRGMYRIPPRRYREDMNIFVSKPACYELPMDENNVPQFAYIHKEHGSAKPLLFGGLEPTGRLPKRINFPLIKGDCKKKFTIAVSGDTQPYSNAEVGYVRDTLAKELADRDDIKALIVAGDVMGDDLGLLPRFLESLRVVGAPTYLAHGNHDLDFDADTDADSSDSFRRIWGPNYYSFTIGKVHFVVLDNVTYPCTNTEPGTAIDGGDRWAFCEGRKRYNGRIPETQLTWLENNLRHVPKDHLIVVTYHIPTVSFVDQYTRQHAEDNAFRLYGLLGYELNSDGTWTRGRPALALSGHTHTLEQLRPGELYEGWTLANHPAGLPFPQIVVGAAAGSWWSGDVDDNLIPESYQRLGAPKGYHLISFHGNRYRNEFKASGKPIEKQMSLSFDSPRFRAWFDKLSTWYLNADKAVQPVPPVNTNNLGDTQMLTPGDLAETELVINVWNGSRDSEVWVQFNDGSPVWAQRTQPGEGEGFMNSYDPHALRRQLNVLRYALLSTESDENQIWNDDLGDRSNGFELFLASRFQAESQQPLPNWMWTLQSNHIWTVPVPQDLQEGVHRILVHTKDVYGNQYRESMLFEVRTPNASEDPMDNDPTDEKYNRRLPLDL